MEHKVGEDGAGHYVKMVHNGIEYGDMQVWRCGGMGGRVVVCNLGGEVPVWRYGDMQVWEHGVMGICGVCINGRPQRGSVCVYGGGESVWGTVLCVKVPKRCGSLGVG